MEEIAICDAEGHRLGTATKGRAHSQGLWHCTVVIVLVRDHRILVYWRGHDQTPSSCWDLIGGHQDAEDRDIWETARREFAEEVFIEAGRELLSFNGASIIGKEGALVSLAPNNREFTTVFAVRLPSAAVVRIRDEGGTGITVERRQRWATLSELQQEFESNPATIADGLRRCLQQISHERSFRCEIFRFLNHQKWLICFACTLPGEPGCGCPDGDFYAEHPFNGLFEDAEAMAQDINRSQYFGDFSWWVEPITRG